MYKIELLLRAVRELKKLTPQVQKDVVCVLDSLKENPYPDGCKKLSGVSAKILKALQCDSLYRVRCNTYRIIYNISNEKITICVVRIGARKEIYKFLK